jgi:hypothetical protein
MPPTLVGALSALGLAWWCESNLPSVVAICGGPIGDGKADDSAEDDDDEELPLALSSPDPAGLAARRSVIGSEASCDDPRKARLAAEQARLIGREKLMEAGIVAGERAAVTLRLEIADDDREATIGRASGGAGAGAR